MDMKFKIIIVVFIVIGLLYAVHFVSTQLDKTKKRETFIIDEDVEHYEEPVKSDSSKSDLKTKTDVNHDTKESTSESKYDTRVLILNDIEKMNISDKEIKGKLMEYLFASDKIAKISTMANTERSIFIQSKYDLLKTGAKLDVSNETSESSESSESSETIVKKVKAEFSNSDSNQTAPVIVPSAPKSNKISSDIYDGLSESNKNLLSKTEEALEGILKAQSSIQQIQENLKSRAIYVDKLPEGYREPDIPDPDKLIEKAKKTIEGFQDKISGFENIRSYASLF